MNTKLLFMTIYYAKKYSISTGSEYGIVLLSTVRSRQLEEITVHGREKKHGGREPTWVSSLTNTRFVLALRDASMAW